MKNLAKSRIHEAATWCGHELSKSKKYSSNEFNCSFEITSVRGGLFGRTADEWVSANECNILKLPARDRAAAYGHEQRHILSALERLQKWGEATIVPKEGQMFDKKADCEREASFIMNRIRKKCESYNNTPDHDKDPNTAAPEDGKLYPPISPHF